MFLSSLATNESQIYKKLLLICFKHCNMIVCGKYTLPCKKYKIQQATVKRRKSHTKYDLK